MVYGRHPNGGIVSVVSTTCLYLLACCVSRTSSFVAVGRPASSHPVVIVGVPPADPRGRKHVTTRLRSAQKEGGGVERRDVFSSLRTACVVVGTGAGCVRTAPSRADDVTPGEGAVVTADEMARRLQVVPTFTIVDRVGVPFTVVGEDAKLSAYFFTTYAEAARILRSATTSADRARAKGRREAHADRARAGKAPLSARDLADDLGPNPWAEARISSVSLDFAVTLALRSGRKTGSYFYVQPAEADVQDALALDNNNNTGKEKKKELAEGKVPLFYLEDMTLPGTTQTPVYFRKSQLLREWKRQHPTQSSRKTDMPAVQVSELGALIRDMVGGGGGSSADEDLRSIVFVPPEESLQRAADCKKRGGNENPFKLGERIIVL